jgi:hypothetical protein
MSSVMDVWHGIVSIFGSADMITLGIMIVIVLAAGFIMQGFESIVTTTVIALVLFGLAGYVRAVVMNGKNAAALAQSTVHGFLGMTMQTLLAYALAFAIGIGIIHLVRSIVMR